MAIEITVPRLGWSMEEGAFVAWLKKDGEFVRAGEALFSIEGDKAVQEIESIDSGILRIAATCPKPGDVIHVGDVLGHLVSAGEAAPGFVSSETSQPQSRPSSVVSPATADSPPTVRRAVESSSGASCVPTISPRALRVATELGIDWTTLMGTGRSGRIRERDIRAVVDSGKVLQPAPHKKLNPAEKRAVILVTGGCGFIGTWVVRELLSRSLSVVVLDAGGRPARWERIMGAASEKVPLVQGSLLDRKLLGRVFEEHHVSNVIHLAALLTPACQADPWEGGRVNVLGSLALFEEARLRGAGLGGFSYASSVAVFGNEPDSVVAAGADHEPPTFYGAFKKAVELIAGQYWRHFNVASVGIRPQVAYGPERETGLTAGPSLAARAAARGEAFRLSYTGSVGYDYVEDVARAFVRGALETPPGANVVDLPGEVADVDGILAAIDAAAPGAASRMSASGPPIPAHTPPDPRPISALYPDWKTTSLAEGMRRTVEFYRSARSAGNQPRT